MDEWNTRSIPAYPATTPPPASTRRPSKAPFPRSRRNSKSSITC
jgi:hypothetical protein